MITIDFRKSKGSIVAFEISGHAGYADHGYDIVCSAVSSVSITMTNGITTVLGIQPEIEMNEDGFLSVDLSNNSLEDIKKSEVLLNTMLLSFTEMAKEYQQHVTVLVKEEV